MDSSSVFAGWKESLFANNCRFKFHLFHLIAFTRWVLIFFGLWNGERCAMTLKVVEKKESEKLETGRSSPTEVDEPGHLRNLKNFFFSRWYLRWSFRFWGVAHFCGFCRFNLSPVRFISFISLYFTWAFLFLSGSSFQFLPMICL